MHYNETPTESIRMTRNETIIAVTALTVAYLAGRTVTLRKFEEAARVMLDDELQLDVIKTVMAAHGYTERKS